MQIGQIHLLTRNRLLDSVFIDKHLISQKSKKQNVVERSYGKAQNRVMDYVSCKLIWLKQLLKELRFGKVTHMSLICDKDVPLHFASNLVFHVRTQHNEIECYFIRENILFGDITTQFVNSNDSIFPQTIVGPKIDYISNKLGAYVYILQLEREYQIYYKYILYTGFRPSHYNAMYFPIKRREFYDMNIYNFSLHLVHTEIWKAENKEICNLL